MKTLLQTFFMLWFGAGNRTLCERLFALQARSRPTAPPVRRALQLLLWALFNSYFKLLTFIRIKHKLNQDSNPPPSQLLTRLLSARATGSDWYSLFLSHFTLFNLNTPKLIKNRTHHFQSSQQHFIFLRTFSFGEDFTLCFRHKL